jgi:hypothetical protein
VNWEGPFRVTPQGQTSQYAEVDVFFPQGLTDLDSNNENSNRTVEIAIEWRAVGSSNWTTVSSTSYTEATYDQRAFTVEIDYGSAIEPEHRYRRVTLDADSNQISDTVEIKRVKSQLETPISYQDLTTLSLKIRGTNALARTAENRINIRGATRKLPTLAELQTGSFDLFDTNTRTIGNYQITDAEQVQFTQWTDIGLPLDTTGSNCSLDFDASGTTLLIYDNGLAKIYSLTDGFNMNGGFTYKSYLPLGGSQPTCARLADSNGELYLLRKQNDPSPNYYLEQRAISIGTTITETGTSTLFVMGSEITEGVGFHVKEDGSRS